MLQDLTCLRESYSRAPPEGLFYLLLLASCRLRVRAWLSLSSRLDIAFNFVCGSGWSAFPLCPFPCLPSVVVLKLRASSSNCNLAPCLHIQRSSTPHLLASCLPPASDGSPCSLVLGAWCLVLGPCPLPCLSIRKHFSCTFACSLEQQFNCALVTASQPASAAGATRLPYYHSSPHLNSPPPPQLPCECLLHPFCINDCACIFGMTLELILQHFKLSAINCKNVLFLPTCARFTTHEHPHIGVCECVWGF